MKIVTWNVNSIRARLAHVIDWVQKNNPDILAIQETKVIDEQFPKMEIETAGYQVIFSGQKTFNGVALLSKTALTEIETNLPDIDNSQRRIMAATMKDIRVVNVYVPNGESVNSEKYHFKLNWLEKLKYYLHAQLKKYSKVMVLGDFNIAPEDRDVHDPKTWVGHVLVSEPERQKYREILNLGFKDAFRLLDKASGGYSWWDYRHTAFVRDRGLRLDLILLNETLTKQCRQCYVDRIPRGFDKPSDHTPVIVEFK